MKFIDLFAGLGGFHLALRDLGHQCVFASEIDDTLRDLYESNFGIRPAGDIRQVDVSDIPAHDILCAGFPCQPFSKAGAQDGLADPDLGVLYKEILKVVKHNHPRYMILENVPNFEKHN
ncbi:MAG: DNA (cytosine-5-)-methyltransferase, partial [Dehalococcoidia bacterium]